MSAEKQAVKLHYSQDPIACELSAEGVREQTVRQYTRQEALLAPPRTLMQVPTMGRRMTDPKTPDNVWELLFEQTPIVLRYVLTMLTLGIFALAGTLYRWHRDDLRHVNERIDRLEKTVAMQHSETNTLLFQIAQNTRRAPRRENDAPYADFQEDQRG